MNLTQSRPKAIIAGIIILFLFVLLGLLAINSLKNQTKNLQPTATPAPQNEAEKIIPPVSGRSPLPKSVEEIKNEIINSATTSQGTDEIVFSSENFRIIYSPSLDLFIAQIFKDPANSLSQSAQKWFLDKGLSQKDLCTLPLRLALFNPALKQTNPNFSLLPQGC